MEARINSKGYKTTDLYSTKGVKDTLKWMGYNRLDPLQKGKIDKIVRINCIYSPKLGRADKALQNYDS